MKYSFTIVIVSAETTKLQPLPSVLRVPNATANPRLSGSFESALVTAFDPERNAGPQPPPNGGHGPDRKPGVERRLRAVGFGDQHVVAGPWARHATRERVAGGIRQKRAGHVRAV